MTTSPWNKRAESKINANITRISPALDGAEYVALLVGEASQTPSLVLQRRLALLLHVRHVAEVPDPHLE